MRPAFAPPATPAPERADGRSRARSVRDVVACSLLVTASAAVVALVAAVGFDVRWSLGFVVARWIFVAVLLATPLLHQLAVRAGIGWPMPWVLSTPATAVLLTVESIAFDIASAQLGG
ncbi:MAG: hypothetical protein JWM98_3112 [Thermoleophilia bacterium]|nr:hypothetical protein [Thermoleophilia bacterium]